MIVNAYVRTRRHLSNHGKLRTLRMNPDNIQPPTFNLEHPKALPVGQNWKFEVECWRLDVSHRFLFSMRQFFRRMLSLSFGAWLFFGPVPLGLADEIAAG